jgi:hypothetical protein
MVYCTDKPVPSVWEDIDEYVYIGFASDNETLVTGVMIEHFSKWLLLSGQRSEESGRPDEAEQNPG